MFDPPVNPGQYPVIPDGAIGPQISEAQRIHKERYEEFKHYDQINNALKPLLIATVDKVYIRTLRDKYVRYANVTTK